MPIEHTIPSEDKSKWSEKIQVKNFHFILSSKIINELINTINKKDLEKVIYLMFVEKLSNFLAENGILYILDITTQLDKNFKWFPIIMNEQLNKFVSKNPEFSTLLPLSCGKYENCRNTRCFTQMIFKISHSYAPRDISKVCYRIICRKKLKNLIIEKMNNYVDYNKHIICNKTYKKQEQYELCSMCQTGDEDTYINSYRLTKHIMK